MKVFERRQLSFKFTVRKWQYNKILDNLLEDLSKILYKFTLFVDMTTNNTSKLRLFIIFKSFFLHFLRVQKSNNKNTNIFSSYVIIILKNVVLFKINNYSIFPVYLFDMFEVHYPSSYLSVYSLQGKEFLYILWLVSYLNMFINSVFLISFSVWLIIEINKKIRYLLT